MGGAKKLARDLMNTMYQKNQNRKEEGGGGLGAKKLARDLMNTMYQKTIELQVFLYIFRIFNYLDKDFFPGVYT
jgi:spore maturation protein CgeB